MPYRRSGAGLQPTAITPLAIGNPITRGLVSCHSMGGNNRFDAAVPGSLSFARMTNLGCSPGLHGLGALVNSAVSAYLTRTPSYSLAAGADYTAVFAVARIAFNGTNPGIWRDVSANNFNIFQGATGLPWIRAGGFDILKPASGFAITAGQSAVMGYRVRSSTNAAFASDGVIRHTATHSTATSAATFPDIGYQSSIGESVSGVYSFIGFWSRALSDGELMSITANPWQVFYAPRRRIISQIAVGGSTNVSWWAWNKFGAQQNV